MLLDGKITQAEHQTLLGGLAKADADTSEQPQGEFLQTQPPIVEKKAPLSYCKECGKNIIKEIKFCGNCGTQVSS